MRYSGLAALGVTMLVAACVAPPPPAAPPKPALCTDCGAAPPERVKTTDDEDDAKCRPYLPDHYAQCRANLERQRIRELVREHHAKPGGGTASP